jgi:hypothetical protein
LAYLFSNLILLDISPDERKSYTSTLEINLLFLYNLMSLRLAFSVIPPAT